MYCTASYNLSRHLYHAASALHPRKSHAEFHVRKALAVVRKAAFQIYLNCGLRPVHVRARNLLIISFLSEAAKEIKSDSAAGQGIKME